MSNFYRNENEGSQYEEHLMTRQHAGLASENLSSEVSEVSKKVNTIYKKISELFSL